MKNSMTGRERLSKTFKGEKVDRISISPFVWVNNVYEMFKYTPNIERNLNPDDFDMSKKYVDYHDHFGFDVLFSMGLLWDNYIPQSAENWEVTVKKEGDAEKVKPRGNWILSCSDFFFGGTPYENIFALTEAGLEYGQY